MNLDPAWFTAITGGVGTILAGVAAIYAVKSHNTGMRVEVNTNGRLDKMFLLLKEERTESENIQDQAREAAVVATSKATADVAAASAVASDRAAKHALTAMPPPGAKS
jgi:hypothetical protein